MATRDRKNRLEGALPRLADYMKMWAEKLPDHPVFIHQDQPITYRELSERSHRLARYLMSKGIQKGDRIAYIMTTRPEWFYLYMAASMVGAIAVGINYRYTANEMLYILENSEARLCMTLHSLGDINYQERLSQILPKCPFVEKIWVVGGPPELPNAIAFEDIMENDYVEYEQMLKEREAQVGPDDGLLIIYTSGTTGQPKGAVLTNRNVVCTSLIQIDEYCPPTGVTHEDVWPNYAPANHVSSATEYGAAPIVAGSTIVLSELFDPVKTLEDIQKHRITIMAGVPTMWAMWFNLPNYKDFDLSAVKFCQIGGAPAPKEILAKMLEITPYCTNPMGMTETAGLITYTDIGAGIEHLNQTVGKIPPELEMKLVDRDRNEVPPGTPGEVAYRGPVVMKEYFRMPEATAAAIDKEGWFYSGDIGVLDEEGNLRLIGRAKEMYITGGYNVYPAEIEEYISRHPGVLIAAVVGVPHQLMGEVGRAYIVPKPGVTLTPEEMMRYLEDYLADYKIPRQYVFRDSLPMTPLGKIEKKLLREEVEKEFAK